ncbi:MAG: radical SAM protein [Desulfarculales bacterium]|jgi:radical SAM superfamily enzyme YgiQ (UPF0313 family)|nr:radical SAM protein [Desulfarculales bacterium]
MAIRHSPHTETCLLLPNKKAELHIGLIYPNTYRAGMAYLGLAVLYRIINHTPRLAARRFFLPPPGHPPLSRENKLPLGKFDLLLATVPFENDLPNLLSMLRQGGVNSSASARENEPLLIAGGIVPMLNPEPLAGVADAILMGEAEAVLPPFLEAWRLSRDIAPRSRQLLFLARRLPFLYVPSLYQDTYYKDGVPKALEPLADVPARIAAPKYRGPAAGLASSLFLSPQAEMGDMFLQEMGRGCPHGCRFCAAGHIYRPPRLAQAGDLAPPLLDSMSNLACKLGLVSAAVNDIKGLEDLAREIVAQKGSFSVSSLRADTLSFGLLLSLAACGQKTVSLAPEAGSERLRRIINKGLTDDDLDRAVKLALEAGILNLRLYFMTGLPYENDGDAQLLLELVERLRRTMLSSARSKGRLGTLTVSLNPFIPKPFTPLQWQPMLTQKEINQRVIRIRQGLGKLPNVRLIHESSRLSLLQGALSRGDRRLIPVLENLSRGVKKAFLARPAEFFACRPREFGEFLPWSVVDHGISRQYLIREALKAKSGQLSPKCQPEICRSCGACGGRLVRFTS